ncbi:MAG: flippase-like domain-containing protein [Bacteroidetes bacterium]|nr:flippase-like domain-containing protein [Bacteroidota bacterium]
MKAKLRKTYNYIIRFLIILATFGFIYREITHKHDLAGIYKNFTAHIHSVDFLLGFLSVFALVFVNWGIEARKWQYLIKKIEAVSWLKAFEATLSGVAVSSFTPNRIGDYLGRVFILEKANRIQGILITIIGSMAQFLTTFIAGTAGIAIMVGIYNEPIARYMGMSEKSFWFAYFSLSLLTLLIYIYSLLFFTNVSVITDITGQIFRKRWEKLKRYLEIFSLYKTGELLKVLYFSAWRFLVFTLQFYILLRVFGAEVPLAEGLILIGIVFVAVTIIPTIAITELGIRGSVSLYVFGLYFAQQAQEGGMPEVAVVAASSVLWLINLAFPALLGAVLVFNLKFFRKND